MKPALFPIPRACKVLTACLLLFPPLVGGYDADSGGWSPRIFIEPEPWKEQQGGIPPYPGQDRLLEVAVDTEGRPYRIYIDPASLSMDEDGVARYTVVIISSSGVWNVSYEGLHCGEYKYRRYAYGFDGKWQPLGDTSWQAITGRGMNRYRKTFYNAYMCSPTEPFLNAAQVLEKLRFGTAPIYE